MTSTDNGLVELRSPFPVPETVRRLESRLREQGIMEFVRIDHCGEADKVGLKMRPTQVILFGNPKAGTALMIASPSLAIDLPLKALVWEDAAGRVWVSYNSPEYLKRRHNIPDNLIGNIAGISTLLQKVVSPPAGFGQISELAGQEQS